MIDFHCHLWKRGYLPEIFWTAQARFFVEWEEKRGEKKTVSKIEKIEKEVFSYYWDSEGGKTLASMDEAGIETAILLPIDFGFSMGEVTIPIEVQNEEIARVALTHTDRFFPFIGIDPRRKGAMDLLKRGVEEWGVRGIKYHGIGEFFPGEELGLPLLEWAEKKNLILLIHQGPLMNPFESKYTHPQFLEPVLKMFPNLRVVAAHMAFGWWRELINLAQKYPLLYTDISGWQLVALDNTPQFIHILRRIIDGMGNDHVLFGTDGPTFDPFFSKRAFISLIKNLIKGGSPPFFSENEINALLKGNAHRLMREK